MALVAVDTEMTSVLNALRLVDAAIIGLLVLAMALIVIRLRSVADAFSRQRISRWLIVALVALTGLHVLGEASFRRTMGARCRVSARYVGARDLDWPATKLEYAKTLASIDAEMLVAFRGDWPIAHGAEPEATTFLGRYSSTWLLSAFAGTMAVMISLAPWRKPYRWRGWAALAAVLVLGTSNFAALLLGADEYVGLMTALRM